MNPNNLWKDMTSFFACNRPAWETLTLLPETATWNHKSMIQRDQRTLTGPIVTALSTQRRLVGGPDQLRPIAMDSLGPSFDQGVGDIVQECRIRVEIRQGNRFKFEPFSAEIRIDKIHDRALC